MPFISYDPIDGHFIKFTGMKKPFITLLFLLPSLLFLPGCSAQRPPVRFHALVLYENGGHHVQYSAAARVWLDRLAADSNFSVHYITNTDSIDEESLKGYQLFVQLDYPPYGWKEKAVKAFESYITKGKGGWIGFHHASLLGEFDGFPIWPWFHEFMGSIRFKDYIPGFADGGVNVEDSAHPCMKGVPASFTIHKEEWYSYDRSPRANVKVIASVDESTYQPNSTVKMGDHPVIWTNPKMTAKNIYIFMGHSPDLFNDTNYTHIFRNAIFWAAGK
jgi:type 1 glutamine amidotransferase